MNRSLEKYRVFYTKTAVKDIQKLDSVSKKKIKRKIEGFSRKPFFYARKLIKYSLGSYRWRIGDYRIIFDIDKDKIIVLRIGHRREIYR